MKEELLEPTDLRLRTGVYHILGDMAGDERHNVVAQHKRCTILAKRSLGVITFLEDFIGPSDSIRTRRSRMGKEVFKAPPRSWRHGIYLFRCSLARCNLVSLVISIIAAKEVADRSRRGRYVPQAGNQQGADHTGNNAMDESLGAEMI